MPHPLDYAKPPPPRRDRYAVSGWVVAAMAFFMLGFVVFPSQLGLGEWLPSLTFWTCAVAMILVRLLTARGRGAGDIYDLNTPRRRPPPPPAGSPVETPGSDEESPG